MTNKSLKLTIAAIILAGFPQIAAADTSPLGKKEYESSCASCHGPAGKGDGPLSGYLEKKAADLTQIMKNNNGVYPFTLLAEIVDGRRIVALHGSGDMPVWGNIYNKKAAQYYSDFPAPYDTESFVRARVLALVEYIYSLQAK